MNFYDYVARALNEQDSKKESKKSNGVCLHPSLFMRVLELVHEDVENDEQIHHLAEVIIELCNNRQDMLTMEDYDEIEKSIKIEDEHEEDGSDEGSEDDDSENVDTTNDQEDEGLDECATCGCKDDKDEDKTVDEQCDRKDKKLDECDVIDEAAKFSRENFAKQFKTSKYDAVVDENGGKPCVEIKFTSTKDGFKAKAKGDFDVSKGVGETIDAAVNSLVDDMLANIDSEKFATIEFRWVPDGDDKGTLYAAYKSAKLDEQCDEDCDDDDKADH